MRFARAFVLTFSSLLVALPILGQQIATTGTQSSQRDPQAVAAVTQSISVMGRVPPADSAATGTVTITAGSLTETGTVRILTRGADQTSEEIQTSQPLRKVIYSHGMASEVEGTTLRSLNMELAVTSQSPGFPLAFLTNVVNDSSASLQYIAVETVDGVEAHHIRFWKTFANPHLQHLVEFSLKDLWINSTTSLPLKLSFERREARGAVPRILLTISYSDYRTVSGVRYPFLIEESLNGSPWMNIAIQNVAFGSGLADADFPVR